MAIDQVKPCVVGQISCENPLFFLRVPERNRYNFMSLRKRFFAMVRKVYLRATARFVLTRTLTFPSHVQYTHSCYPDR